MSNESKHDSAVKPIPLLMLTDIGRDIDDTLALLALIGYHASHRLKIVGIIATGGANLSRACIVSGWLNRLTQAQESSGCGTSGLFSNIPVAVCGSSIGLEECYSPPFTQTPEEAKLYHGSAVELILELCRSYPGLYLPLSLCLCLCLSHKYIYVHTYIHMAE